MLYYNAKRMYYVVRTFVRTYVNELASIIHQISSPEEYPAPSN